MPAISGLPDAMSDVLALVRMRGEFVCANDFSAPWSYAFSGPPAHFHIVERGTAWLTQEGVPPLRVETGDLVLLPLGAGHALCSEPGLPTRPIAQAIADEARREGAVYRMGGGGALTQVVCGRFSFAGVL